MSKTLKDIKSLGKSFSFMDEDSIDFFLDTNKLINIECKITGVSNNIALLINRNIEIENKDYSVLYKYMAYILDFNFNKNSFLIENPYIDFYYDDILLLELIL